MIEKMNWLSNGICPVLLAVADPGFPRQGGEESNPDFGAKRFLTKTTQKWKKLYREGVGAFLVPPLDPPMVLATFYNFTNDQNWTILLSRPDEQMIVTTSVDLDDLQL